MGGGRRWKGEKEGYSQVIFVCKRKPEGFFILTRLGIDVLRQTAYIHAEATGVVISLRGYTPQTAAPPTRLAIHVNKNLLRRGGALMLFTKVPASGVWLFVRGGLCLKPAPPPPASRLNISEWREDKAAR